MKPLKYTSLSDEWAVDRENSKFVSPGKASGPNQIVLFGEQVKDGRISARVTPIAGQADDNLGHDWRECSIVFRYGDSEHSYIAGIGGYGKKFYIAKVTPAGWPLLAGIGEAKSLKNGEAYPLRIEFKLDRLVLYNNDVSVLSVTDSGYVSGDCGLRVNRTEARFELVDIQAVRPKCFVIMPFKTKLDSVYAVVKKTVEDHGFECIRADERVTSEPIMDDVKKQIAEADVVVVDFTGKNPNVYYEAGMADAYGKKRILLAQSAKDLAFDIRHIRTIIYSDPMGVGTELHETLCRPLREILRAFRGGDRAPAAMPK